MTRLVRTEREATARLPKISVVATMLILVIQQSPAMAGANERSGNGPDCFQQLVIGRGERIECDFPTRMTEQEKAEVRRISRGVLQDAHCLVKISIERKLIDEALSAGEHNFQAPPQPVACTLDTKFRGLDKRMEIKGTFAPRVTFKDGQAIEATPGLDNVTGVPRMLSYPVQLWVNKGSTIREGMLKIVNAFKARYGQRRI